MSRKCRDVTQQPRGLRKNKFILKVVAFPIIICLTLLGVYLIVKQSNTTMEKAMSAYSHNSSTDADYRKIASITTTDFSDEPFNAYQESLDEVINCYRHHPRLGLAANRVEANISQYQQMFSRASQVSPDVSVDVILQMHGDAAMAIHNDPVLVKNQETIVRLLSEKRYDVVAYEGYWSDPINRKTAIEESSSYNTRIPMKTIEAAIDKIMPIQSGLAYALNHPEALVIGSEDRAMMAFDELLINEELDATGKTMSPHVAITLRWRDQIAIAKTLIKLRSVHGKRAVIVIGQLHRDQEVDILRHWHVLGDIYMVEPNMIKPLAN